MSTVASSPNLIFSSTGRVAGFYDGNLTVPTEIEGTGEIETDPVTTAHILKRKYTQLRANYVPLTLFAPVPDFIYPGYYLTSERVVDQRGGLTFFDRIYAQVPPPRIEQRLISFTYPGQSAVRFGSSGYPIGWDPYGVAAPKSRLVTAKVNYTYAMTIGLNQDPATALNATTIQPSQITFNGKLVDYVGPVYAPAGTVYIPQNRTVAAYQYQGQTSPPTIAGIDNPWIHAVDMKRWMGMIWELAVVTIPNVF